tara:strand:+ start:1560 stop:1709 length:150 start_codon:yes stop_codon:yes gene_type:complete
VRDDACFGILGGAILAGILAVVGAPVPIAILGGLGAVMTVMWFDRQLDE